MRKFIISVWDSKIGAYLNPFFVASTGEAIRSFTDLVNDGKSQIALHPSDYSLYVHGTFDDDTGLLLDTVNGVKGASLLCTADTVLVPRP